MRRTMRGATLGLMLVLAGGLLLSFISHVRNAAAESRCKNNLRGLSAALLTYHDSYARFPEATCPKADLPHERRLSWMFELDPFVHARMDPNWLVYAKEAWDSERNLELARKRMPWFLCPMALDPAATGGFAPTNYVGPTGAGFDATRLPKGDRRAGLFGYDRQITLADITDGAATTVAVIETSTDLGSWIAGGPATIRALITTDPQPFGRERQFGGLHVRGCNTVFVDGSVQFLSNSLNPNVLAALLTIAGGDGPTPLEAD